MGRYLTLLLTGMLLSTLAQAQIGGQSIMTFNNLSPSARVTALGGELIALVDDDIALGYRAPSLLNSSMHQQISLHTDFYPAGIRHGLAAYGYHWRQSPLTFSGAVQFIHYGTFTEADETGAVIGEFTASEYNVQAGAGFQYTDNLSFGLNLKWLQSYLEAYRSHALAVDLGITWNDTSSLFNATLLIKNLGTQLLTYQPGIREPLPFDVQLGVSKRLRHTPFRFYVTGHNLYRWDIRYDDPSLRPSLLFFDSDEEEESTERFFFDNLFRHFIFGAEIIFGQSENFRLRIAYNHIRNAEMQIIDLRSFAGMSFGFGFKVRQFRIDYGRAVYHVAGGTNHISIGTNLSAWMR